MIIATDEVDQSGGDAATWIAQFQALKLDPEAVAISGIYGLAVGCPNPPADADPMLAEIIAQTGGVEVSICEPDWSPVLTVAPTLVSEPAARFPLSEPAMPLTLEVAVEAQPVTAGWSYDEAGNAVVFEPDSVPEPGEVVTVQYHVVGECPAAAHGGVR